MELLLADKLGFPKGYNGSYWSSPDPRRPKKSQLPSYLVKDIPYSDSFNIRDHFFNVSAYEAPKYNYFHPIIQQNFEKFVRKSNYRRLHSQNKKKKRVQTPEQIDEEKKNDLVSNLHYYKIFGEKTSRLTIECISNISQAMNLNTAAERKEEFIRRLKKRAEEEKEKGLTFINRDFKLSSPQKSEDSYSLTSLQLDQVQSEEYSKEIILSKGDSEDDLKKNDKINESVRPLTEMIMKFQEKENHQNLQNDLQQTKQNTTSNNFEIKKMFNNNFGEELFKGEEILLKTFGHHKRKTSSSQITNKSQPSKQRSLTTAPISNYSRLNTTKITNSPQINGMDSNYSILRKTVKTQPFSSKKSITNEIKIMSKSTLTDNFLRKEKLPQSVNHKKSLSFHDKMSNIPQSRSLAKQIQSHNLNPIDSIEASTYSKINNKQYDGKNKPIKKQATDYILIEGTSIKQQDKDEQNNLMIDSDFARKSDTHHRSIMYAMRILKDKIGILKESNQTLKY